MAPKIKEVILLIDFREFSKESQILDLNPFGIRARKQNGEIAQMAPKIKEVILLIDFREFSKGSQILDLNPFGIRARKQNGEIAQMVRAQDS
jgi:hypothetical protein